MNKKNILSSLLIKFLFGVVILGGLLASPIKMMNAEAFELKLEDFYVYEKEEYSDGMFDRKPIEDGVPVKVAVLQGDEYTFRPYVCEVDELAYVPVKGEVSYEWFVGAKENTQKVSTESKYTVKLDNTGINYYTCNITCKGKIFQIIYEVNVVTAQELQYCENVVPCFVSSIRADSKKVNPISEVVAHVGVEDNVYPYVLKENIDYKVVYLDEVNLLVNKPIRYKIEYMGSFKDYGVELTAILSIMFDINIKDKVTQINATGTNYNPEITSYNTEKNFVWHYYSDNKCKNKIVKIPNTPGVYYARVSCGNTYSNLASVTLLPAKCSVKVAAKTDKAVKLMWNKTLGANYYRVFVKKNNKWITVGNTTKNEYVVKGLSGFTIYEFAVRPCYVNSNKKAFWAKTFTPIKVRTNVATANKPVVKVSKRTAVVGYTRTPGVAGYQIFLSKNNGAYKRIFSTYYNKFYLARLSPGTYKIRIRCYNKYNGKEYVGALTSPVTFKVK